MQLANYTATAVASCCTVEVAGFQPDKSSALSLLGTRLRTVVWILHCALPPFRDN